VGYSKSRKGLNGKTIVVLVRRKKTGKHFGAKDCILISRAGGREGGLMREDARVSGILNGPWVIRWNEGLQDGDSDV